MTSYSDTYQTEDEAESTSDPGSMSFLDHLDELRSRLIRSAIFVLVAFLACWGLSDHIYHFLEVPVRAAMIDAKRRTLPVMTKEYVSVYDFADDTIVTFTIQAETKVGDAIIPSGGSQRLKIKRAPDGVVELVTIEPWLINQDYVIPEGTVIPRHLYGSDSQSLSPDAKLVVPTVQGAFNLYIKVAFYAAIFFAVPFLLVQAWGFISPGLYPHEKKYAVPFIVMASVFFVGGCAFAYYIAFPRAANFLLGVAEAGNLRPLVSADEYFDLILTITLGLGVVFEMPTVTLFL
ncbi:MAG TPA: twin-arginine translocase subunit TatC, partial [Blastocatellia bacterium]|jgi:sec-independent protein translocase protein TatC|nr:twin-arginine translocase subunit TatC [Blastocatellia bacterium]